MHSEVWNVTELSKQQKKKKSSYLNILLSKKLIWKAKSCKEEENSELRDYSSFEATHFM